MTKIRMKKVADSPLTWQIATIRNHYGSLRKFCRENNLPYHTVQNWWLGRTVPSRPSAKMLDLTVENIELKAKIAELTKETTN